jgi:hypothetical protein
LLRDRCLRYRFGVDRPDAARLQIIDGMKATLPRYALRRLWKRECAVSSSTLLAGQVSIYSEFFSTSNIVVIPIGSAP